MPDDLTSALDQIRERGYRNGATGAECARLSDAAADDVPLLLAAIERALEKADEWGTEAKRIDGIFAADEDPWPRTVGGMRAQAFEQCAKELREAITAELTKGVE